MSMCGYTERAGHGCVSHIQHGHAHPCVAINGMYKATMVVASQVA